MCRIIRAAVVCGFSTYGLVTWLQTFKKMKNMSWNLQINGIGLGVEVCHFPSRLVDNSAVTFFSCL